MFTRIKNNKGFSLIETALVLLVVSASIFAFVSINNLQVQKTALENYSKDIASTYQTFLDAFIKYVQKVNPATSTTYTCTTIKADPGRFLPDSFPCTDSFGQSLKGQVSFKNGVIYSYFVYGDPGSVNVSNYLNAFNIKIPVQLVNFFIQATGNLSDINKKFLVIQNKTTIYQTTPTGYATASAFDIFGDDNTFISSLPIFNFAGQNYTIGLWSLYGTSGVYTLRRVNLTNATSDYMLQVGEEAIINFTNATSVPLRIAVAPDAFYELYCSAGAGVLYPNNSLYTRAFRWVDWGVNYRDGNINGVLQGGHVDGFSLGNASGTGFIVSYIDTRNYKTLTLHAHVHPTSPYSIRVVPSHWINPTTWTSLGYIGFSNPLSGYILVKRLV